MQHRLHGKMVADALGTSPAQFGTQVRKEVERMDTLVKRYPVE
jgi:hypothetical protein